MKVEVSLKYVNMMNFYKNSFNDTKYWLQSQLMLNYGENYPFSLQFSLIYLYYLVLILKKVRVRRRESINIYFLDKRTLLQWHKHKLSYTL